MKKYRIAFKEINSNGMEEIIFTTIVMCKSMRGARRKASNIAPRNLWHTQTIVDLTNEWNLKLDKIEYET